MARLDAIRTVATTFALLASLAGTACSDGGHGGGGGPAASPAPTCDAKKAAAPLQLQGVADIAYEVDIRLLVSQRCIGCHLTGTNDAPEIDFLQFSNLAASNFAIARKMVAQVTNLRMPPKTEQPLEQEERTKFRIWGLLGFPENHGDAPAGGANPPPAETDEITYDTEVGGLITQACLGCHDKGQQAPDLTSFEQLSANDYDIAKKVLEEVIDGDMPRPDPLTAQQLETFTKWRDGGFLQSPGSTPAPNVGKGPTATSPEVTVSPTVETEGEISTCQ
jgi:hypothetical protein